MIGHTLVTNRAITAEQLEIALEAQRSSGGLLGDILLNHNFVNEETLARALAEEAGVPFVAAVDLVLDPAAASAVPERFARRHLVAPVAIREGLLQVLQANPIDVVTLDELQRLAGRMVDVACATRSDVLRTIDRAYGGRGEMGALLRAGVGTLDLAMFDETGQAPVVRLIELMLNDAVEKGATDLHIEPEDRIVRIRYRVDGVLLPGETLPKDLHPSLVSRVKVLAGLDIAEQRLPQDGRMSHVVSGRPVDLRVATFPTTFGEKVAIRILEKEKLIRGLGDLGFSKKNLLVFQDVISKSRGIILVTGPTGVGKTTTLYSALQFLGGREKNIITVEDPVEYEIPSIRQTQIRPKAGFTFATAVRSLVRQDPDVIFIGEIRDAETAQLALRAALSGVLVFSTLHTQDSSGAIPRLMDMGLEAYLLASSVVAVVAQRLVRVICADCREPVSYPPDVLAKVGLTPDAGVQFYRGAGCDRCFSTSYHGRVGVFEILTVDSTIHALIRARADSRLIKDAALKAGMKSLLDDALAKAVFGQTTIEEVLRVAYE